MNFYKTILLCSIVCMTLIIQAQNVGIGTSNPLAKLHVAGSFRANAEYKRTSNTPTPAQTFTMINGTTTTMQSTDSIGRAFDPGGQSGNYLPGLTANFSVNYAGARVYLEVLIESLELGTGDSLIVYTNSLRTTRIYSIGNAVNVNNTSIPVNTSGCFFEFKSNSDASTGTGFSILLTRIYFDESATDPAVVNGSAMVFYPERAAFRAGENNVGLLGLSSAAVGFNTEASGAYSAASGYYAKAQGLYSTASGKETIASGLASFAIGEDATASGTTSFAIGLRTLASGSGSISIGTEDTASGNGAIALGSRNLSVGPGSLATGSSTRASGQYSATFGASTISKSYGSFIIGRYNDTLTTENPLAWLPQDRVFVIGNGTFSARSNAMVVYKNGNTELNGYVRIGKESEGAPSIKTKKITIASGPAINTFQSYALGSGITDAKVIGVQIMLTYSGSWKIPPSYMDASGYEYNIQIQNNNLIIALKNGNSASIGNKPITALITYEE